MRQRQPAARWCDFLRRWRHCPGRPCRRHARWLQRQGRSGNFSACRDPWLGGFQRLAPRLASVAETDPRSRAWEQVRKDLLPVIARVREKKTGAGGR
jgi:hypothetical protein